MSWALPAWCGLLTVLVMAPLARPGFVLSYDMVTVPRQRLVPDALGLGSALPRAVPQDAVLALLTSVVPGAAVYRLVLIGLVFGAALGAGRLLPQAPPAVQAVAASAYGWNTYVAERLAIGHWTLLVSYAVLPWLLRQALAVRDGRPGAVPRALLLVAVASITPTGGVLASALLVLVVLVPQKPPSAGLFARRALSIVGCLAFQLPWIVPGLLTPTPLTSDPAGVEAFSARPDSPLGLVGSVLTLGGIWNAEVVPESRGLVSAAIVTLAWALLALVGVRDVTRLVGKAGAIAVASLAAAGVLLSFAGGYGTGLAWAMEHVPAAGLLRDGHKFLAWYALLLAPAAALGAARVASVVARRTNEALAGTAVAAVAAVLPLAALPDLAWGVAGRIEPVTYPATWPEVRRALSARPDVGALVVLPFQPFRSFTWNDHRTVLDPLPRYVGLETVVPDSLTVDGKRLAGEDPRAAAVDEALTGREPLRELLAVGVGWVVVEHGTPGAVPEGLLNDLDPVLVSGDVDLYRLPGVPLEWKDVPPTVPVIGADLLAVGGVAGCCVATAVVRPKASVPDTVPTT